MTRAIGDMVEHPEQAHQVAGRWLRGRASPLVGMFIDLAKGATFMGEKLDSPAAFMRYLATRPLPFAVQAAIREGPTEAVGQFFGLRAFPESAYDVKNHEAQRLYSGQLMAGTDERYKEDVRYKDLAPADKKAVDRLASVKQAESQRPAEGGYGQLEATDQRRLQNEGQQVAIFQRSGDGVAFRDDTHSPDWRSP